MNSTQIEYDDHAGIGSTLGAVGLLGAGTWLLFNEDEKKEADDLESAARIAETKANAKRAEVRHLHAE